MIAWHTTCVPMQRIGSHPGKVDHIFECHVKLANGVSIMDCVVIPDLSSYFSIGIANTTVCDIELRQGVILGSLDPIQHLGRQDVHTSLDPSQEPPCFGIWQMASLVRDTVTERGEVSGLHMDYVDNVFFLDERSVHQHQGGHSS